MSRGGCRRAVRAGLSLLVLLLSLPALPAPGVEPSQDQLVESYRQALRVDPDNLPLHYYLGAALLSGGDDRGAASEFRHAYPAFTDSAAMQYNLGLACFGLGDLDSARLYFDRAESLGALGRPDVYPLADAYYNLALAYLNQDDFGAAQSLSAKVLALVPERVDIHRLLGDCLERSGDTDGALEEFALYLKQYPADTSACEYVFTLHFNRGLKQLEDNDLEAARASFASALAATPDSPVALYYLGSIAYRQQGYAKAADLLGPIYADAPAELRTSTRSMLYNSALNLLECSHPEQARKAVAWVVAGKEAVAKDFYLAGNIDLALQDYAGASIALRRTLALDSTCRDAALKLAKAENGAVDAYLAEGRRQLAGKDYQGALGQFEKALAIHAEAPHARELADRARAALAKQAAGYFASASTELDQGHPHQALEEVHRGLAMVPKAAAGLEIRQRARDQLRQEIDNHLASARQRIVAGDPAAAAAAYRQILEVAPDEPQALAGLAELAGQSRTPALAAIARGDRALEEGRLDDARKALREASALAPDLPEVNAAEERLATMVSSLVAEELLWARRARSAGRLKKARGHFARALALEDSPGTRRELASVEAAEAERVTHLLAAAREATAGNHFRQACNLYDRLLDLVPDHPAGRHERAQLESRIEKFMTTEMAGAQTALAAGNIASALTRFRRLVNLDPANNRVLAGLEAAHRQLAGHLTELVASGNRALGEGRFADAGEIFRQALAIDPYQAAARAALGRIRQLRLSGVNPGDEEELYLQGLEFYTAGKYGQAVASWQEVLSLDPGQQEARMNIEQAQRKLQPLEERQGG